MSKEKKGEKGEQEEKRGRAGMKKKEKENNNSCRSFGSAGNVEKARGKSDVSGSVDGLGVVWLQIDQFGGPFL